MILLILYNYTARQVGAAKITMHQAITAMLMFFSMEKLENSGTVKALKGGTEAPRAAFSTCPCRHFSAAGSQTPRRSGEYPWDTPL